MPLINYATRILGLQATVRDPTLENPFDYTDAMLEAAIDQAVARERERCAKAAEWYSNVEKFTAADVAARIRKPESE